jgi:hypothetical protein
VVPPNCQDGFEIATFQRNWPEPLVNCGATISRGIESVLQNDETGSRRTTPAAQKDVWTDGAPGIIQMADHTSVSRGGK